MPGFPSDNVGYTRRLIRVCRTCANIQDKPFDLHIEQAVLAEPCPKCGYDFPIMPETRYSMAVFKEVPELGDGIAAFFI